MLKKLTLAALLLSAASPSAQASSDDAWAEFATKVEEACLGATSEILTEAQATVDPFGSENYGLAVVTGKADATTTKSIICVYDKKTEAVEIGGELDLPAAS